MCAINEIDVKWCFDDDMSMYICLKVVVYVDEYVFDDVCLEIDIEMYMLMNVFRGWTLLKRCLMFVWTGPQDGGSLMVWDLKCGIGCRICFEKQNNEMGFKWGR